LQSTYPPEFDREYGCTEAEWLRWLPGAVGGHAIACPAPASAVVSIGLGQLQVSWETLAPRRIGLAQFPRQTVRFRFSSVPDAERASFMRYFDLYMQRGGG
jgi:hypothetical protein